MMTQQLGFSILTAPLAAIDRRALSQAWYSSLHLAHETQSRARLPLAQGSANDMHHEARVANDLERSNRTHTAAVPKRVHAPTAKPRGTATVANDRRCVRSPLARKIERAFLDPRRRVHQASFTVDGKARIHIALQTLGNRVRLVALCPPSTREAVARALSQARFALADRGIELSIETAASAQ